MTKKASTPKDTIAFRDKDYEVPRLTFRVQHEIEKAWATRYSQMTEAQRAAGMLWYMVRSDIEGFTVEDALDEELEQFFEVSEPEKTDTPEDAVTPL